MRLQCTKDHPYTKERDSNNTQWEHDDVEEIDCSCDCCAKYKCNNCGLTWKSELPQ